MITENVHQTTIDKLKESLFLSRKKAFIAIILIILDILILTNMSSLQNVLKKYTIIRNYVPGYSLSLRWGLNSFCSIKKLISLTL